jgi:hypothetical protein
MYRHNGLRPSGLFLETQHGIYIEIGRRNIDKNWLRPQYRHGHRCSCGADRWHKDFVSRPNTEGAQRDREGVGSRTYGYCVGGPAIAGKFILKSGDRRSEHVTA